MPRLRYLVDGKVATGRDAEVSVHISQIPVEAAREIGLRALGLQKQRPNLDVLDVEIGDLLAPRKQFTIQQAQAQHDAYMRTAGWALDQAAAIDREYDLPLTKDDEDAMLTEIARHGGPQADRNLVEGKTQSLGRVLDGLAEES